MNSYLLVFIGGGLGSLARYALGNTLLKYIHSIFPWSTLTINILASFILGLLAGFMFLSPGQNDTQRLLLGVGFCGGFSTFSTFTLESFELIKDGNIGTALLYMFASIAVCLLAFYAAYALMKNA
ncbi:fluoride efflux transporter CrcB [soil metagenome]